MAFIEAQQVRFSYDAESVDAREVLHGVDLSIEEGEFVALLGHNGCGKSTMAKLFNGMLVPTAGKVLVGGIDTSVEETQLDVRRQVGLVLQNPDNQLVAGVVEEDVAFGPENLGVPPEEIRRRVEAALKAVDMYEYREHAPHKLSGGQKQRVAIAGIIAMEPKCIVLDEPTAMLDPRGRAGGDGNHPAPEPGEGHHHRAHHPLHGRGGPGGPGGGDGRGENPAGRHPAPGVQPTWSS